MRKKADIKQEAETKAGKAKAFLWNNRENALAFLLCLFLSFMAWLSIMQNKSYELWINYPLKYVDAPRNVELYADLPASVSIRIRDKGKTVFSYQNRDYRPAEINFANRDVVTINGSKYSISLSNVFESEIKSSFGQSTVVVDYFPKEVEFDVIAVNSKRLPVELLTDISCRRQYQLSSEPYLETDSVTLYAVNTVLDTISSVKTHLLKATNLSDTLLTSVGLSLPVRTKAMPERLGVVIPVEAYTEGSRRVPIIVNNAPNNLRVRTFPEQVTVKYRVGVSKYKEVEPSDFRITIDYDHIIRSSSKTEFPVIEQHPDFVTGCKLDPVSVEWMIEVIED